jgi:hypothetical protein
MTAMECDGCGERTTERKARETIDHIYVCPDCAEGMTECAECSRLFEPENDEEEVCPDCKDEGEASDLEDSMEPRKDADIRQAARGAIKEMVGLSKTPEKTRAEIVAELNALSDAELKAWIQVAWGPSLKAYKEMPDSAELERRAGVFADELRLALGGRP